MQGISICLWFDTQAEEAARFYTGIFPNSVILGTSHYTETGREIHGRPAGSVMTVVFELNGHKFTALNGGPIFTFNEAVSFPVACESQDEIDYYWDKLSEGGDPQAQQCGWVKDKFGVSWQIVPAVLEKIMQDPDPKKTSAVMAAFLPMKKLDLKAILAAYETA